MKQKLVIIVGVLFFVATTSMVLVYAQLQRARPRRLSATVIGRSSSLSSRV